MKKIFFAFALLFSMAVPAFAEDGNITILATQPSEVLAGDSTFFTVDIINYFSGTDYFSISVYPSDWTSIEDGISSFRLSSGEKRSLKIFVSPPIDARASRYVYTIEIRKEDGERSKKDVVVSVQQRFQSLLLADASLSCNECKDSVNVYASVKNVGNTPVKNAKLVFSVGNYKKTVEVQKIFQGEEKTLSQNFLIYGWAPKTYTATVEMAGPSYDSRKIDFSVPAVKKISTKRTSVNSWWGSTAYITLLNEGNTEDSAQVNSEGIQSPLFAVYPNNKPSSITGNALTWYATLKPGESAIYSYSQVFWPLPFGVLFALVASVYGYFAMTAIEIRKYILGRGEILGVSLRIKNRGRTADGVIVRDVVPHEFSVVPAFETLKPIMRKISDGTELIWRIGSVQKGEETVLHYKIKSSGSGSPLPPAQLKALRGESRVAAKSNFAVARRVPGAQAQQVIVSGVE